MSNPSNYSPPKNLSKRPRYQKIKELGRHPQGTRVTYLAKDNVTQQPVVIKKYIFDRSEFNTSAIKIYKDKVKALSQLKHPSIPRYLSFLPTEDGFCTVREYKKAKPLGKLSNCEPEQFKQIASSLLETLVYLQNFEATIIHRNITPENILVDEQLNVYLVDFGLPYIDNSGKPKNSLAGTPGFMPREQVRNRELSEATDLYGVGATLSCLLTQTASNQINQLMTQDGHLNIAGLIPEEVSFELVEWLEIMMKPYPRQRYPNAVAALESLNQIDISRSPEVKLKPDYLEFTAASYGEQLAQIVTVTNDVPGTLLQGSWQVNPDSQKPNRRASSRWIACEPAQFEANQAEFQIKVDTSKLMAHKVYEREIILNTNAQPKTHPLIIQVQTAPLITEKLPLTSLIVLLAVAYGGGFLGSLLFGDTGPFLRLSYIGLVFGMILGGVGGMGAAFGMIPLFCSVVFMCILFWWAPLPLYGHIELLFGFIIGVLVFSVAGYIIRYNFGKRIQSGLWAMLQGVLSEKGMLSLLMAIFGISLGIARQVGLLNALVIVPLAATGIPVSIILFRIYFERMQRISKYHQSEPRLVKP